LNPETETWQQRRVAMRATNEIVVASTRLDEDGHETCLGMAMVYPPSTHPMKRWSWQRFYDTATLMLQDFFWKVEEQSCDTKVRMDRLSAYIVGTSSPLIAESSSTLRIT
jgi:hypothetical protein